MDIKQLDGIKSKIKTANDKKSRALGALEQVMASLKKDYDCETQEDAEKKIEALQTERERDTVRLNELLDELGKVTDWSTI